MDFSPHPLTKLSITYYFLVLTIFAIFAIFLPVNVRRCLFPYFSLRTILIFSSLALKSWSAVKSAMRYYEPVIGLFISYFAAVNVIMSLMHRHMAFSFTQDYFVFVLAAVCFQA